MASSIFNSVITTAVLFAGQIAAQDVSTSPVGNWDIDYMTPFETNFVANATDEIILSYNVGKARAGDPQFSLFDKGCAVPINSTVIVSSNGETTPDTTLGADQDVFEIIIDLDKTKFSTSNIYDNGSLGFCAVVQLLDDQSNVITEDKRDINISFEYLLEFNETASVQQASQSSGGGVATIDGTYVKVCKCSDPLESFICNTNVPLASNAKLNVCIESTDPEVELSSFKTLKLFQPNTGEQLLIIDGSEVLATSIAALLVKNSTHFGVESVVPSAFFDSTAPVEITGSVSVAFSGTSTGARRLGVSSASKDVAFSGRDMRGEGLYRPGYGYDDAAKKSEESEDFAITIGLQREAAAIPQVVQFADDNSGCTTKTVGWHALGFACIVWALYW